MRYTSATPSNTPYIRVHMQSIIIMQSTEPTDSKSVPGKGRPSKVAVEDADRMFRCGCGKLYQSYAALYTHAKAKHDGQFPANTVKEGKRAVAKIKVGNIDTGR